MKINDAISILNNAVAQISTSRDNHNAMLEAIQVITKELNAKEETKKQENRAQGPVKKKTS